MSTTFENTDELNAIMQKLWTYIKENKRMSDQLLKSRLIVRFKYNNPDGQLTVDASNGRELDVTVGDCDAKADVEMRMNAEVANEFWSGKLNLPAALISGKIKSIGPVHRALALIPVVKPARAIYPHVVSRVKDKAA